MRSWRVGRSSTLVFQDGAWKAVRGHDPRHLGRRGDMSRGLSREGLAVIAFVVSRRRFTGIGSAGGPGRRAGEHRWRVQTATSGQIAVAADEARKRVDDKLLALLRLGPCVRTSEWAPPPDVQAIIDGGRVWWGGRGDAGAGGGCRRVALTSSRAQAANGGEIQTWALVPNRVSIEDLISSASSRVTAQVPDPSMTISPDPRWAGR